MKLPESISVTDQKIDLTKITKVQQDYFFSLAGHIKNKYLNSDLNRYVVSISGPSGSGKSVLAVIVAELLKNEKDFRCHTVDLDSFHFSNLELDEKNIAGVKGRYDTYDTNLISELLGNFKNNEETCFPYYSRQDHEPHKNGVTIPSGNAILLLPGLWFQRNDDIWGGVRKYIDFSISIEGNKNKFRENTINRHIKGGRTIADAEKFYDSSDINNVKEIIEKSVATDLVLPYYAEIESDKNLLPRFNTI